MIKKALDQDKEDCYFRTKICTRKRKRVALAQEGTCQGGIRAHNEEGHNTQAQNKQ